MMRFRDRADAGKRLARALDHFKDGDGIVYPLPRGGIVLGIEVAGYLHMPLDLLIPRKIGHPWNPEYALCAVTEHGEPVCNEEDLARIDPDWFAAEVEAARKEARRRRALYLGEREPLDAGGKTAILVDDGIATGLTMRAAIRDVRERKPARIVVAVPVGPADTVSLLEQDVDEVVTLEAPEYFLGAVGAYYADFSQLTDADVIRLMRSASRSGPPIRAS
jgi:putative phosphoribosyl transferase